MSRIIDAARALVSPELASRRIQREKAVDDAQKAKTALDVAKRALDTARQDHDANPTALTARALERASVAVRLAVEEVGRHPMPSAEVQRAQDYQDRLADGAHTKATLETLQARRDAIVFTTADDVDRVVEAAKLLGPILGRLQAASAEAQAVDSQIDAMRKSLGLPDNRPRDLPRTLLDRALRVLFDAFLGVAREPEFRGVGHLFRALGEAKPLSAPRAPSMRYPDDAPPATSSTISQGKATISSIGG